ncbi:MAG: hypothetical protein IKD70_01475 [Eggerthellaceae bacterium]|nr:hypothetical protein [Eggerthellaceae bacterium]
MVIEAKDFEDFNAGNYDIAGTQTKLEPAEPNEGEPVELADAGEAEDEELWEMEIDDDAILYYIEDEDGNEIGFCIEEDGKEVEYYYAEDDGCDCGCEDEELIDMEVDEDAILYYIEDEDGNEIGFAVEEDGKEVEYYYAEDEAPAEAAPAAAGPQRVYADNLLGDIRRKTDGFLEKAEDKLDNGEMSDEAKKVMGGVAEAADTLKEFKDTMRDLRDAFSFKL